MIRKYKNKDNNSRLVTNGRYFFIKDYRSKVIGIIDSTNMIEIENIS